MKFSLRHKDADRILQRSARIIVERHCKVSFGQPVPPYCDDSQDWRGLIVHRLQLTSSEDIRLTRIGIDLIYSTNLVEWGDSTD